MRSCRWMLIDDVRRMEENGVKLRGRYCADAERLVSVSFAVIPLCFVPLFLPLLSLVSSVSVCVVAFVVVVAAVECCCCCAVAKAKGREADSTPPYRHTRPETRERLATHTLDTHSYV